MKVNGLMEKDKVSVSKYGLMDPNMLDSGKTIKPMVKELFTMLMVTFMKENGLTIRLAVKEPIPMKMVPNMLDNGKMINKMDTAWNSGLMDKSTKESIRMEQKLEKVF